jgi:hypothetical protein
MLTSSRISAELLNKILFILLEDFFELAADGFLQVEKTCSTIGLLQKILTDMQQIFLQKTETGFELRKALVLLSLIQYPDHHLAVIGQAALVCGMTQSRRSRPLFVITGRYKTCLI